MWLVRWYRVDNGKRYWTLHGQEISALADMAEFDPQNRAVLCRVSWLTLPLIFLTI